MVPPWVPDAEAPGPAGDDSGGDADHDGAPGGGGAAGDGSGSESGGENPQAQSSSPFGTARAPVVSIAPAARFGGARRSLGKFASTGNAAYMRRGVKNYVRSGYGGGSGAVKRFGGTASTAGALYGTLSGGASAGAAGQPGSAGSPLDRILLTGRSAREIIDAVVESARPADGTQDGEASRAAIRDALSELLTMFPTADLLNLDEEQRDFAIERFVAIDVYRRLQLDLGKTIQEKAPTATVGLARLKEVKGYVKETVAAAFRKLRSAGIQISTRRVGQVVRAALGETFRIFEGYAS